MASTVSRTSTPPTAKPPVRKLMAVARMRSNQLTTATMSERKPPRLSPTAITTSAPKKCAGVSMRLKRTSPPPNSSSPMRMMARGPKRSVNQPCTGPTAPFVPCTTEWPPASIVLLQPKPEGWSRKTAT